jgi:hypothetical protein
MHRRLTLALLLAALLTALFATTQSGAAKPVPRAPKTFFGIGPQTALTERDFEYMKAAGIGSVRLPIAWAAIQPTAKSPYLWEGLDGLVEELSRKGLRLLPVIYGTPPWLNRDERRLPVDSGRQRRAWTAFLKALVARYKPGGEFWLQHAPGVVNYESEAIRSPQPIREWQIWNEVNFFYFASPVSVPRYARLVNISGPAIKSVDPNANVMLSGLFGEPKQRGAKGMKAVDFLERLYRYPGIKSRFDSIALHPYAVYAEDLEEMVEEIHEVTVENRDRPGFYITELGWGSQNNFQQVAFEQGPRGQAKQLRDSYTYMLENRGRLNLKAAYWFSWKDAPDSCSFCDSVGLFHAGKAFKPKPAWRTFLTFTRGLPRPR